MEGVMKDAWEFIKIWAMMVIAAPFFAWALVYEEKWHEREKSR